MYSAQRSMGRLASRRNVPLPRNEKAKRMHRNARFTKQTWFSLVFIFGMAAYLNLSRRSYFGLLFGNAPLGKQGIEPYYVFFLLASFVLALLSLLFPRAVEKRIFAKDGIAVGIFAMAVLGIAALRFFAMASPAVCLLGVFAFSGGTVFATVSWAVVAASANLNGKQKGILLALSFLVSALFSLGSSFPFVSENLYMFACPILTFSSLLLLFFRGNSLRVDCAVDCASSRWTWLNGPSKANFVYLSIVYLACSGMLGSNFTGSLLSSITPVYIETHLMLACFCLVLFACLAFLPNRKEVVLVTEAIGILAFIAMFLFSALLDTEWISLGVDLIASSRLCFELLLWITLLHATTQAGTSPVAAFAFFSLLQTTSSFIINLVVPYAIPFFGVYAASVFYKVLLALFFLLSLSFLVLKVILLSRVKASSRKEGFAPVKTVSDFEEKCDSLANAYGLSKREHEIFGLVAKGYSSRWISESLCISISTVQTHTKSCYRKMGVHSKQDIIELVNGQS